jgi:hypothetical protein
LPNKPECACLLLLLAVALTASFGGPLLLVLLLLGGVVYIVWRYRPPKQRPRQPPLPPITQGDILHYSRPKETPVKLSHAGK